jgi:hypothetical protein
MVTYISRSEIGLVPPTNRTLLVPLEVKNFAWHYPGMAAPIDARGDAGLARVKAALRGWQTYHMQTRGWSDIAYCVAVDQVGRGYTLRGIPVKSAANGGTTVNEEYGAALLVLGNDEEPSELMKATARGVAADYRRAFARIPRRPTWHGAIRPGGTASDPSTSCPGARTIHDIEAGEFDASSPTTTPPPLDDWEAIMALFDSKEEFEASIAQGTLQGMALYFRAFFKDEAGTGDTIWDEAREFQSAVKEDLDKLVANTTPKA